MVTILCYLSQHRKAKVVRKSNGSIPTSRINLGGGKVSEEVNTMDPVLHDVPGEGKVSLFLKKENPPLQTHNF